MLDMAGIMVSSMMMTDDHRPVGAPGSAAAMVSSDRAQKAGGRRDPDMAPGKLKLFRSSDLAA